MRCLASVVLLTILAAGVPVSAAEGHPLGGSATRSGGAVSTSIVNMIGGTVDFASSGDSAQSIGSLRTARQ